MAITKAQQQQQSEWVEVTPAPREWDADWLALEKGDVVEGWLVGTRTIREQERFLIAVFEKQQGDDQAKWRKYILPQHALLEARLKELRPPVLVRIENLGMQKLPTGRRAYTYKVLHNPNATAPAPVLAMVEPATEEEQEVPF